MREVKAEVFIPLTQGKVTVIDFEDFEKVRGYKWHAEGGMRCSYRSYSLGYFSTQEEGARAYDAAAKHFFGEFASTNLLKSRQK